MRIVYRTGDLLSAPEVMIAHGCNARGVMGAGVAKAIRQRFPEAWEVYRAKHRSDGLRLGEVYFARSGSKIIANCITQDGYGRGGRHVDYDAVAACMTKIDRHAAVNGITEVATPLIGAGLAGGDWRLIAGIIERTLIHVQPVVYTLDGRVPGMKGAVYD